MRIGTGVNREDVTAESLSGSAMRNRWRRGLTHIGTRPESRKRRAREMNGDMTTANVNPLGEAPAMPALSSALLSHRDRAVLRAVGAGRCVLAGLQGMALRIDGLCCADQFAGARLAGAGLIAAATGTGPAQLTPAGRAALGIG
jgi:hypothetical protein